MMLSLNKNLDGEKGEKNLFFVDSIYAGLGSKQKTLSILGNFFHRANVQIGMFNNSCFEIMFRNIYTY